MAIKHVRARHTVHGGVAALSERALELGMLPGWVKANGPVPKRPKSAARLTSRPAEVSEDADAVSANEEKE